MTYDEKWDVLASYSKHKNRLKTLLLEREELRDLKKMSDDVGGVPTPGNVSDPTGNTAVRLMRTMHDVERELRYSVTQMEKVKRFIRNSSGINHDEKYILFLKFLRGKSNREIQEITNALSKDAVRKQIYRIVQRMEPKEAGD
nr:MAG TPA: Protein of unknown function (DUF722) [Caudoviricetes sp.]